MQLKVFCVDPIFSHWPNLLNTSLTNIFWIIKCLEVKGQNLFKPYTPFIHYCSYFKQIGLRIYIMLVGEGCAVTLI